MGNKWEFGIYGIYGKIYGYIKYGIYNNKIIIIIFNN